MNIKFVNHDGCTIAEWQGDSGATVLQAAQEAGVEMEGACEGNMACATCHVIFSKDTFTKLPSASEDEEEMLDFVPYLTSCSRLGCQVILTDDLDGVEIKLPAGVTNFNG